MGAEPVTWHLKVALSPNATSIDTGLMSKRGGCRRSAKRKAWQSSPPSPPHHTPHRAMPTFPGHHTMGRVGKKGWRNKRAKTYKRSLSVSYKPVRRSLALEDAVPRAFWAEQVYWPQWAILVCKIWRVATLFKKADCMLSLSLKRTPSLYQDTWIGSEPVMRPSNVTGAPTASWISFSFLVNVGGSWRSAKQK